MLGPAPGGGGIRFRLAGFPVAVHPSFLVVAVLLGLVPGATPGSVAIWATVVLVSVLVHELGHALAARRLGSNGEPQIDIYALGGLTRSSFHEPLDRRQAIGLALAGPFAGFVLGGVVLAVHLVVGELDHRLAEFAFDVAVWVNLGWGAINLLPVLPLDGGHVVENLLPGNDDERARRGAVVSMATGSLAAVALVSQGIFFGGLMFAMLVATNLTYLRVERQYQRSRGDREAATELFGRLTSGDVGAEAELTRLAGRTGDAALASGIDGALIEEWALSGRVDRAREALAESTRPLPPSLYALVDVCASGGAHGLDALVEIAVSTPTPVHAHHLVLGAARAGRPEVAASAFSREAALRVPEVLQVARRAAAQSGSPVLVAALAGL